jgi:Ca2+-transporting ATPase
LRLTHLVPADDVPERRLLELAAIASRHDSNDPLDAAILTVVQSGGALPSLELIERMPFTESARRETAIVRYGGPGGEVIAATKGSTEVVLAMAGLDARGRAEWEERIGGLAATGHKVIGCAWRLLDGEAWTGGEPQHGYRFAGLLAFEDPVRDGVDAAVAVCNEAGIRTIMVTGDHPLTARAVAQEIGLGGGAPQVITADDLEQRLADAGSGDLSGIDAIARAAPSQKLGLVRALQRRGEIVAVTGDGVNDVPALQAADVGVAMGGRGTRSAREVASIVLLDDDFATIVRAIAEGRQLFRNLKLSFTYLLMIHIPLVITAALVPLAGYPVLYLPIHIVWLELIIHPTALLVFQDLPADTRLAPAERRSARFFSTAEWTRIVVVGVVLTGCVAAGYEWSLGIGRDVEHARAMALAVLVTSSALVTAALSRMRSSTSRWVVLATVGSSVPLIQVPALAHLLHLQPLHLDDWGLVALAAAIVSLAVLVRIQRIGPAPRGPRIELPRFTPPA